MHRIVYQAPSIFSKERLKNAVKSILGRQRGPTSVKNSLLRGLKGLGFSYKIGMRGITPNDTVHVLTDVEALKKALELKRTGKIKRLIVGPNISITPHDHDGILLSPEIDLILQPSEWSRNFYVSEAPQLSTKIKVWASGVEDPYKLSVPAKRPSGRALIYQKNGGHELYARAKRLLETRGIAYETIGYGSFRQNDFYAQLEKSDFMIYLSTSESQGLALQEAWIRDVPTLVWNRGYWSVGEHRFIDSKISAPYLTDESGMFFNEGNFEQTMDAFLEKLKMNLFAPRTHCLENLTDGKSAKAYIDILTSL